MSDYHNKSMKALQLAGMSSRTQECYTRSVRQLTEFYGKAPEKITESELGDYFLHRKNKDHWAAATMRIAHSGIKFYFVNILKRDWHLFKYLRTEQETHLPCILSKEDVFRILKQVTTFHNYTFLSMAYACGLRISEGLAIEVSDIDSKRMLVHVHRGKGAKDRYVPLPKNMLDLLRRYWLTHRNPRLLFPARGRGNNQASISQEPMALNSVRGAFRDAKARAGINKRRVCVHTLRHCYATHLLEAGVNLRIIQQYMGHSTLESTMVYLHLTQTGTQDAYYRIDKLMQGFNYDYNN